MSVFEKVGTFDESFDAAEDFEFNTRIDKAGLKCWFDPAIAIRYEPRKTLGGLWAQVERYGRGRVRLWRKHRHTASLKSFAPGFFVVGTIIALLILILLTVMRFTPEYFRLVRGFSPFNVLALFSVVLLGIYAAVVMAESGRLAFKQKRWDILLLLPVAFVVIHFGYGWGIFREFFFPKCGTGRA